MPTIESRIEQAPACTVISLNEAEKDIYTGAGWKLARFRDGRLIGFFDPQAHEMLDEMMDAALGWLSQINTDEAWLVMCSCYQLCEPRRVTLTDASALAKMARVFGEQFSNL